MNTYIFVEKQGNAVVVLSEDTEQHALEYLSLIVKDVKEFRLDSVEEE